MIKIREAIVVEGRYDKHTLSQVVDTFILETNGFGLFRQPEKQKLLQQVARARGLIVLTDSDGAGFVIRNRIKGMIPADQLKHAYIPDVPGRERRKRRSGREGKLGVEGMSPQVLLQVLRRAKATILGQEENTPPHIWTVAHLHELGLSGQVGSSLRRKELLQRLDLPEHLSTRGLLDLLNCCGYTQREIQSLLQGGRKAEKQ